IKPRKASTDSDPKPRLQRLNDYLERNFPDFFAEARFQVGDDDYFLYARFEARSEHPPDAGVRAARVHRGCAQGAGAGAQAPLAHRPGLSREPVRVAAL